MNGLCSHERLELALAGKLDAADESMLQLHLDDCELCAAEMERLAGGEQASREIAAMLVPDELDDALPLREECSTADFVVDHLEPSDDAAVLGRLGGYDVLDIIGRGGMGVVLKGFDRELKRFVAIKALAPHLAHSALARKRFAREAQAAAAVVNLHVIAIHQVQPNGQLPFLVMPLLTGESLAQRLKARGTLELKEILRIGMQAAEGLAAAHGQGLIHRDVKPANILLEKGVERAVLTDFGLARAADDVSMTRWGIIAGTPEYMSPEQARGEALDGRSDLFSLGCVLYEMATGVSPFRTDSTMATLRRIVDEQPAAMASLVPELPPWFCHIVERLLSKDSAQRFASASEVSQLLEQCLSHLQQPTSVPLPASLVPQVAGRRSIFKVPRKGVLAMLGTIGMTLLGLVLLQATEAPDISGQWTSDEWGTVVLEAKGSGKYEGTFSGANKGQTTLGSGDFFGRGSSSTTPAGAGGVLPGSANAGPSGNKGQSTLGGLGGVDSAGRGSSSTMGADAGGVLPGSSGRLRNAERQGGVGDKMPGSSGPSPGKAKSGTLQLKWSRVERRFNGTWGKGGDRRGMMSLRLVDQEIRGGWTTDEDVQLESGTPLLGDLLWTRNVVILLDGGKVRLRGPKRTNEDAKPLDRQNARSVVEAFVAAILARDIKSANALARNNPDDPKLPATDIEFLIKHSPPLERLPMKSVYVFNNPNPPRSIALSEVFEWHSRHAPWNDIPDVPDRILRLELSRSDEGWFVIDAKLDQQARAEKELKEFHEADPKSISVLPQAASEAQLYGKPRIKGDDASDVPSITGKQQQAEEVRRAAITNELRQLGQSMHAKQSHRTEAESQMLDFIRDEAWSHVMQIASLQYAFEVKDDDGWHAQAKCFADQSRFRVNHTDVVGMQVMGKRIDPMTTSSAFDGVRQQHLDSNGRLRLKKGPEGASYGIGTPHLDMYQWLRRGPGDFRWDTIRNKELWNQRFAEAEYIGAIPDNGRTLEIVDFPQRLEGQKPHSYRVMFARDLRFIPIKSLRRDSATTETSTTVTVTDFVSIEHADRRFVLPTAITYTETRADGVSLKQQRTTTVAVESLKVNEPIDETTFTIDRKEAKEEVDVDQQEALLGAIRWGEPVNGLRLGARFEGANDREAMQFRDGDRASIELYLQNVGDQETDCGFDPADVCKWPHRPHEPEPDKKQPDEILHIRDHNGEVVKPEPLSRSNSRDTYRFAALSKNYATLRPQEIRRIDGQMAASDRKGRPVPLKDFVSFRIVTQKPDTVLLQRPHEFVLLSGKQTAGVSINFFKVGRQFRLECPALEFVVDGHSAN